MGRYIVKLADHYLEWSTVVDAPVTYGMTLEEFKAFYTKEYGEAATRSEFGYSSELDKRLERVAAKGTSAHDHESAEDTVWLNRAGPKEKPLHVEEIIEFYVRRQKNPTEKELADFRKGLERCGEKCPARPDKDGCAEHCERCWGTDFVRPAKKG